MKKLSSFLLFLTFLGLGASLLQAQTRPRRIGQTPPASSPNTSTPTRPPVLGGATRPSGSQNPAQSAPVTNDGPEEVEAGDVIKVNTTLVT
ncbi:MAG: hypothetical protein M3539_17990, partial [Acidobacteriota bacterium]|nr:hypothetical protein [Acidobacteriota bacterium]